MLPRIGNYAAVVWVFCVIGVFAVLAFASNFATHDPDFSAGDTEHGYLLPMLLFFFIGLVAFVITLAGSLGSLFVKGDKAKYKPIFGLSNKTIVFLVCALFFGAFSFLFGMKQGVVPNNTAFYNAPKDSSCTRLTPYDLQPEFQRAISLIKQRSQYPNENWIYNCVDIQYGNALGAEGVFYFDDTVSSLDKLVIVVDRSYREADDLLTAALLSHELQHAGQYVLFKKYGTPVSCIQDEVSAFFWQYQFIRSLNNEERNSIVSRLRNYSSRELHNQLQIIEDLALMHSAAEKTCLRQNVSPNTEEVWSCYVKESRQKIEKWVVSNPHYQKQCEL